ncbi:MAG: hypothetical protein JJE13_00315 [Thermoleophilia bacterium]|nr:hypothetical protein [Thermoleophilia bacterium]
MAELRRDLDAHQFRHGQADQSAELARDDLGDEGSRALAGTTKLDDVETVVVGFDQAGQGTAFPECGHVSGGDHLTHRFKVRRQIGFAGLEPMIRMLRK